MMLCGSKVPLSRGEAPTHTSCPHFLGILADAFSLSCQTGPFHIPRNQGVSAKGLNGKEPPNRPHSNRDIV